MARGGPCTQAGHTHHASYACACMTCCSIPYQNWAIAKKRACTHSWRENILVVLRRRKQARRSAFVLRVGVACMQAVQHTHMHTAAHGPYKRFRSVLGWGVFACMHACMHIDVCDIRPA